MEKVCSYCGEKISEVILAQRSINYYRVTSHGEQSLIELREDEPDGEYKVLCPNCGNELAPNDLEYWEQYLISLEREIKCR